MPGVIRLAPCALFEVLFARPEGRVDVDIRMIGRLVTLGLYRVEHDIACPIDPLAAPPDGGWIWPSWHAQYAAPSRHVPCERLGHCPFAPSLLRVVLPNRQGEFLGYGRDPERDLNNAWLVEIGKGFHASVRRCPRSLFGLLHATTAEGNGSREHHRADRGTLEWSSHRRHV